MTAISDVSTFERVCLIGSIAILFVMITFGIFWLIRRSLRRKAEVRRGMIDVRNQLERWNVIEFNEQMEKWRSEGYDVSDLEDLFK